MRQTCKPHVDKRFITLYKAVPVAFRKTRYAEKHFIYGTYRIGEIKKLEEAV